jgi:hypothetical protein
MAGDGIATGCQFVAIVPYPAAPQEDLLQILEIQRQPFVALMTNGRWRTCFFDFGASSQTFL